MASITAPPPGKHEWLVVVPDKPGTREKRLEVRAQHFEGLKPYVESKQFKTGGAVLNDKPESDDPATFDWYGSTLVVVAESKEEVKAILEKDIYTRTGVWDTEKVYQFLQT
ncbi:putative dimeric alpha-beta barrel protein [Daldinia childiae]|uniref:putative dimeric alpha-beta barrel protein n=1 Tax=Daldinia childiae TaxID=326645 RepID=UPI001445699E|nr:putative dimeric alpha-beta barrel protein [Daldinia childiae]KAF3057965.1 putative dimeric alpha-beta barrel protein [Daldinia childiae]